MIFVLYTIIYILAIAGIFLILLILLSRHGYRDYKWFVNFSVSLAAWISLQFAAQLFYNNQSLALLLLKFSVGVAPILVVSFFVFIENFLKLKQNRIINLILATAIIPLFILSPTELYIQSADISLKGLAVTKVGPLYLLVIILVAVLLVISFIRLTLYLRRNRKSTDEYAASRLLFIGALQFAIINLFANFFLSNNLVTQLLVPLTGFTLVAFISYAIFKHGLFDIKLIVARSVAYTLSVLVVVASYSVAAFGLARLVSPFSITLQQEILLAAFSAVAALSFQPLKRFFDKFTNSIFYRDAYDSQEFLNKINSNLVSEIDLYKLLTITAEEVNKNLKTEFCNFYVDEKATIDFHTVGTNIKIFADESWGSLFKTVLNSQKKTISEIGEDENLKTLLSKCNIGAVIKMESQDQYVGYLIVGIKKSGNAYSNQDLQILEIIADEVAIAVQNTLRFEEIAQFNITLQKRIEDATARLQKTNEKLVALDEAKDEFISMASHQLRTPLTSIKGYLSMLQEGDAGELNEQQHNFVDQAFLSSQRMVYLIADLLNVSRLKTGKFVIEAKPTYLPDAVEGEIKQLAETAKARDLEMVFNKPTDFPMMNLDETKIRQVIMNFADNAVYYTPNGGKITIQLKADENNVIYSVTDTGIGVPKSEQHKLFTKFYRAGNARKARPDGTGLGLFMAKKVVVAQGGAIIFKTQEGKGSTFGFSFPRAKLELKDVLKPSTQ